MQMKQCSFRGGGYSVMYRTRTAPTGYSTHLTMAAQARLEALFGSAPSVDGNAIFTDGILAAIGNTPLIEIRSLSAATGCRILGKAEFLNPGGSIKDRAALRIIAEAEAMGFLVPRAQRKSGDEAYTILEGTGGNTGIGLALVAAARGYKCHVFAPENCSTEKVAATKLLGATVTVCPAVPFSSEEHYYHRTAAAAMTEPHSYWGNQFETLANARAHAATTGPEILRQAGGKVDAIALSAGTGGTIAGLSLFLRSQLPDVKVFLVDPPGSSLCAYVEKRTLDASPGKTIAEGIGINRLTANFEAAHVDASLPCTDAEIVAMAHYLIARDGLSIGPSAALNCCGAVHAARLLGPGHTIVTVLCDGGERYASKFLSTDWLRERALLDAAAVDATRDHADFVLPLPTPPSLPPPSVMEIALANDAGAGATVQSEGNTAGATGAAAAIQKLLELSVDGSTVSAPETAAGDTTVDSAKIV